MFGGGAAATAGRPQTSFCGGKQVAMAAAARRSPDGWKRDIVRQLERRDRNQHAMFRDFIRFCTTRHASRAEPNLCLPKSIQTKLPEAQRLRSSVLSRAPTPLLLEGLNGVQSPERVRTESHVFRTDWHFGMEWVSGWLQTGSSYITEVQLPVWADSLLVD